MNVQLKNWSIRRDDPDMYKAPEMARMCVVGVCYGHHRKPDGARVRSSAVVKAAGRVVHTVSGTVYELVGPPDEMYRLWAEHEGINIDNPFDAKREIP